MSDSVPAPHPLPATIQGRFAAALRIWWRRLDAPRRRRVAADTLHRLSDHHLADIGLRRDDIDAAVHSMWRGD